MTEFESGDVQRLRWFVTVAEELHFARAAKSLNISRPKLSATVIDLETELGTKLFVPGAQPTELTEAGRDLLRDARELISRDDERYRERAAMAAPSTLRVGFVPGVTVAKWARIWGERFPGIPLEVARIAAADQSAALRDARVDMCFVRLPIDGDGVSVIPLYHEVPVVLVPKDHPVSVFDQVGMVDLADEQLHDTSDMDTISETVELVAAGVGLVVVPHSIARLHARKDVVYRTVADAADTEIALAWLADRTTDLVEEFVGIVRGRSARSSRTHTTGRRARTEAGKTQADKGTGKARAGAAKKNRKRRGR